MDKKPAQLSDILNYQADTYFSTDELTVIKNTFGNNPVLIKLLRKIFLPSVGDLELPPEEVGNDVWLIGRDYASIPDNEIKSIVLARQEAIKFIIGGIIKLKMLANQKNESTAEKSLRERLNSNK